MLAFSAEAPATTRVAPAKINLALHVTGRRDDGYHLLETLAVFTRFGDRLTIELADADRFEVTGPFAAGLAADEGNLVLRARDALRACHPETANQPVAIRLEKNLPIASGVGGGSSDAAATLKALNAVWSLAVSDDDLTRIGASIGADVPMCLAARPLLARGVGDAIAPLPGFGDLALVLVNPGVAVSTADVFRALTVRDGGPLPRPPGRADFHGLRNWLETTRNDLEPAACALAPEINGALAALRRADAGFARMSGSGATCFGLFETGNVAKRAAIAIRKQHPGWFVASTRSGASDA